MEEYNLTRFVIGCLVVVVTVLWFINRVFFKHKPLSTKFITRSAILGAMSTILYVVPYFQFHLPFFPSFLEFHFDEVPALIASLAYGPFSAAFVILIKTLIKLPLTSTLGVGELADFIYGILLVVPAGIIYKKLRTFKGGVLSVLCGALIQTIGASLITSFPILDFYMLVMQIPEESLLAMCQIANPKVTSLGWTFFGYVALPFNALKDLFIVIFTLLLYKKMHQIIDKIGQEKN